MRNRLTISIPTIAVVLISIFYFPLFSKCLFSLIILRTLWEFYTLFSKHGQHSFPIFSIAYSIIYLWFVIQGDSSISIPVMIAGFFGLFCVQSFDKRNEKGMSKMALSFFGFFYITFLGSHTILLYQLEGDEASYGAQMLFYTLLICKWSDGAAYIGGKKFGKHKLIPRISPNKSWEGLFFGLVAAVVPACFLLQNLSEFNFSKALAFCLVVGIASILGDLGESMLKRELNEKDAANDIPGFGGTLDMADSLLMGIPVAYWFLQIAN